MKRSEAKRPQNLIFIIGGLLVVALAGPLYSYFGYYQPSKSDDATYTTVSMTQAQLDGRHQRIHAIYTSLGLSSDYQQTSEDIFSEKRVYLWDKSRSFSSSRTYVRQANVDETVAELRPLIERAGFSFVGEPYPNAIDIQLHFKSAEGEYLRLSVSSKPRDDAVHQASIARTEPNYATLPYRDAPSNVLIKVNLDDNNE